jgi:hypothetical protein
LALQPLFGLKALASKVSRLYLKAPLVLRVVSLLAKGLRVGLQEAHPALLPVHQVHLVGLLLEQKRQLCLLVYPADKLQV